ncbi:MAG: hypothetical protein GY790_18995 [Bacteroidetes bacterium]|nr:hypothetical protein [Bacteroidota bacterium]
MRNLILITVILACYSCSNVSKEISYEVKVDNVENADISLNGIWKLTLDPPDDFYKNEVLPEQWQDAEVPNELLAQGFMIEMDKPFVYKRPIDIPNDFAGNRILLNFKAINNLAKVYVNGTYVTKHQGGFTEWHCDITDFVEPGKKAWLAVEVTNISREISFNGKAQRPTGGIVRDVLLQARPKAFMPFIIVSSPFDDSFTNATLQITGLVNNPSDEVMASFQLFDPDNKKVALKNNSLNLSEELVYFSVPVENPVKWDAEHPNLYRLQVTIEGNGQNKTSYSKQIGFRDIRFDEQNNLLINGKITKLRGGNRHLSNPTGGKTPTREYEYLDTKLAKEANLNFFRTSHYPPGEGLLTECDKQGMYVTVESAIVDVGKSNRPSRGMESDPDETKHFLSQLKEMILTHGSHPSAIVWSTANESVYGLNFQLSYEFCKQLDPSRPVISSYQVRKDTNHASYDIYSDHYPKWNKDYSDVFMPTIYDEWMHALGHTSHEWFHDPNGRDYWGRSLDIAWSNLFPTATGSIGGAIWNYIDDVTYYPEPLGEAPKARRSHADAKASRMYMEKPEGNVFGVARWGIIDEWRRKKPEHWNAKKAYSPIKISQTRLSSFTPNQALALEVNNRYDHTRLDEISMKITYNGESKTMNCPPIEARQKGSLGIPAFNWKEGTAFLLEFYNRDKELVDIYRVALGEEKPVQIEKPGGKVKVETTAELITIKGDRVEYHINPKTGLFISAQVNGENIELDGPYTHIYSLEEYGKSNPITMQTRPNSVIYDAPVPSKWILKDYKIESSENGVKISVEGKLEEITVIYTYTVGGNGRMNIDYHFSDIPELETPDKNIDYKSGHQNIGERNLETGIKFIVGDNFDELAWNRKGYWSYYPEDHISTLSDRVPLFITEKPVYRQHPNQPWRMDVHDWYYQGVEVPDGKLLPRVAQGAKVGIYNYDLLDDQKQLLSVLGDGESTTVRYNRDRDRQYYLYILDTYDVNLRWGNYSAFNLHTSEKSGKAMLQLGN